MSPIKFHNKTENKPRLTVDDVNVVPPKTLKPAIGGTVVGNFMEWYDFGIYGYLTVTMTAVFTQGLPSEWQLLAVMFGFAVSYLVRPLGESYSDHSVTRSADRRSSMSPWR